MPQLTDTHRQFIVTRLACFESPSAVKEALDATYSVQASLSRIVYYDPTNMQSKNLADKWRGLFWETRRTFTEDVASVPIAHKAYRLKMLDQMFREVYRTKNYRLAMQLLEQVAKEVGGKYTNKSLHEISGQGGGPIETVDLSKLSMKQLQRIVDGEPPEAVVDG